MSIFNIYFSSKKNQQSKEFQDIFLKFLALTAFEFDEKKILVKQNTYIIRVEVSISDGRKISVTINISMYRESSLSVTSYSTILTLVRF